jgi:hypothetical protein
MGSTHPFSSPLALILSSSRPLLRGSLTLAPQDEDAAMRGRSQITNGASSR